MNYKMNIVIEFESDYDQTAVKRYIQSTISTSVRHTLAENFSKNQLNRPSYTSVVEEVKEPVATVETVAVPMGNGLRYMDD